jgi:DNA polymerase V
MGFQSPAQDYIQRRLTVNDLIVHNPAVTLFIERDEGMLVVDRSAPVKKGDRVALVHEGMSLLARTGDRCIITDDGQKIAGEALDNVIVLGKVTYEIVSVWLSDGPI